MTQSKIIGLTGGSGSGKSTVADILRLKGAFIIDTDCIAREIAKPGESAYEQIVSHFGSRILLSDGCLNRKQLAMTVFADKNELLALNAITHPIIADISKKIAAEHDVSVIDAPLLFDCKPILDICDRTVLVCADLSVRINRIMARDNLTLFEAEQRINAQRLQEDLIPLADIVIENNGSVSELTKQIDEVWTWL